MTDHRRAIWFIVLVIVLSLWAAFNTSNNLAAFLLNIKRTQLHDSHS